MFPSSAMVQQKFSKDNLGKVIILIIFSIG